MHFQLHALLPIAIDAFRVSTAASAMRRSVFVLDESGLRCFSVTWPFRWATPVLVLSARLSDGKCLAVVLSGRLGYYSRWPTRF